jgi:hypothetical protein
MAKRALRGRDTRNDDWEPEELEPFAETFVCQLHEIPRPQETTGGNKFTTALACGHIHVLFGHYQTEAPVEQMKNILQAAS